MKIQLTQARFWPAVLALGLMQAASHAQTFSIVKSFGILTNVTGFNPQSALVQGPDGTLYGTARNGEVVVAGTIFKMQPDGSGFTVLKRFTNSIDGANPYAGLALSGDVVYGTAANGGSSNYGTVFKLNTDGTGYAVLKDFTGADGATPYYAALLLSGGLLYGATYYGGNANSGTLFKVNTNGADYTVLRHFATSDGVNPNTGLTLSSSVLYGTTENGGSANRGTIFRIDIDGTGYTVLHNFADNPDGAYPDGVLTLSGNVLYGTTYRGGTNYNGTVFKINTDGTGYAVLKIFDYANDGGWPSGPLPLSDGVLYGTAAQGGSSSYGVVVQGTVFKINTDGTDYTVLKNFAGGNLDGATPLAGVLLSGGMLYGTAANGGSAGNGVVFRLNTDGTSYSVLKDFAFSDAIFPYADLALSGNVLYGTSHNGGNGGNAGAGNGTVFKVNTDGTGSAVLHAFTADYSFTGGAANLDGYFPQAGLVVSGNTLYGTAYAGGISHNGTVFAVATNGTAFTTLYSFTSDSYNAYTNTDGSFPLARLVLSGNILYGTAERDGSGNNGTVFAVNTDGTGFTTLHTFSPGTGYGPYTVTNSDGAYPEAGLVLSGNTLYGTASTGGDAAAGTVFAVNTDGTGFRTLHSFTATPSYPNATNSDGAGPYSGLILSGNTLFGTASYGGSFGGGTVFALNTDGTSFWTLHSFTATPRYPNTTNSDGAHPYAGLILSGNTLYGTTPSGGSSGNGTVFAVNTNGTDFTSLYSFTSTADTGQGYELNSDGARPQAGLILSGNTLYGTASAGGAMGEGTIFSISFRPQLTITPSGSNIIVSWPTNVAGFDYTGHTLQSTTNLVPPVVWVTNSPVPVVVNGQDTVTNPVTGVQMFYRLIQ